MSSLKAWKEFAHGTRSRYVTQRCRCDQCREANRIYINQRNAQRRAGDVNGLVSAAPAREHIKKLGRAGVGIDMVAEAASTSVTVILQIKKGTQLNLRARTLKRILAVSIDCRGDGALVSAASTWRRIQKLVEEGFSQARLARELGKKGPLQFNKTQVTVRTRARVERLFEKLTT